MKTQSFYRWRPFISAADREAHQELVAGLAIRSLGILDPEGRKSFMENEIAGTFGFRRVEILIRPEGPERFSSESMRVRDVLSRLLGVLDGIRRPFLNEAIGSEMHVLPILQSIDATYAFSICRGDIRLGVLAINSSPRNRLSAHLEHVLQNVCSQIAIVLENSRLLKGKLELQNALAQQAQMAQLGEMTARIAHEIKNPLSAMKTIVQVMREDPSLHPQYTKDLNLIVSEMDRLSGSVMQLLNFARPGKPGEETFHLRQAAESALQFLGRDIEKGKMVIENEIPIELPPLPGSQATFREIFLNLILNAMQAGGEGTHVCLQAWEGILDDGSEKFVLLVVEDDGPGIPLEIQEKVFAPFFTTKQRGTGLGLAIVKRDVEYIGGRVTLESPVRNGRGTRFLMHVPLR